jgi:hypothetical protein
MKKLMTVSYQNRWPNRRSAPKIVIANHLLTKLSGFSIGDKFTVEYLKSSIIITKINSNL